jgi:hypothetical protein
MIEPSLGNRLRSANEAMTALYKPHLQTQTNTNLYLLNISGKELLGHR